jgi:predicted RNA binding protein YcfA (HicA-like mRNA interferase family)
VKDVELLRILVRNFNFAAVRQKGSHVRLTDGVHYVTIPIHNRELKQGTLMGILKQAGLAKGDIENYL